MSTENITHMITCMNIIPLEANGEVQVMIRVRAFKWNEQGRSIGDDYGNLLWNHFQPSEVEVEFDTPAEKRVDNKELYAELQNYMSNNKHEIFDAVIAALHKIKRVPQ